jgi:hypothetical protein
MRKLIALDVRAVQWLAGRLGFWRIDVIYCLARAHNLDQEAARWEARGLHSLASGAREASVAWRARARGYLPARARESWRKATA